MLVSTLSHYPVKSMLGQQVDAVLVTTSGLEHDRRYGLLDPATGFVATAKHPRLWRRLLQYSARAGDGGVRITMPDGRVRRVDDPSLAAELSSDLGRTVELRDTRPVGSVVERSDPEVVLERGVDADVETPTLEIAQGAAEGTSFVDHSPVHLLTTATLDHLGVEALRYRPNVIVRSEDGAEPFAENAWVGREMRIGEVVLRITLPTPRCAVPTLSHGDLPPEPDAVRPLTAGNRVEVPGFGVLPCAGAYAQVVRAGTVHRGDEVRLARR